MTRERLLRRGKTWTVNLQWATPMRWEIGAELSFSFTTRYYRWISIKIGPWWASLAFARKLG